jgi:hypothetical protein
MFVPFAHAAEFRVRNWDEVVNEVDGPDIDVGHPGSKALIIQAGVTNVQIDAATTFAASPRAVPEGVPD